MDLVIPDKYESFYKATQAMDPSFVYGKKRAIRADVEAIDLLLEKIGSRQAIESESDWEALNTVISFFEARWPNEFKDFTDAIPTIRDTRREGGLSESGEIKYVGAMPPRLERLVKICFPYQEFNKDFVYKLIHRVKLFKVS